MAKEKLSDKPADNEVTVDAPATAPPGLTIQDLSTAMQIIGVVQSRGAIKPDEMVIVGNLYSKLQTFLEASGTLAKQAPVAANLQEAPADEVTDGEK
jgi:hypothetical protein